MTAVVKIDTADQIPVVRSESEALLAVIARAAADPACDVDKMERLLNMQERVIGRQAKAEFDTAMAQMQSELPSIGERGGIKDRNGNIQSRYALWEDINAAIKPIMQKHGFALSFRTDFSDGVTVSGVLSHKGGHREETSIKLPSDTSGSKNAVQAIGSSVSYGKRYTASALLNLTSHGEDDDGFKAGQKLDNQALDWISVANELESLDDYKAQKAKMLASYSGEVANVPRDVVGAFNRAFSALRGGK